MSLATAWTTSLKFQDSFTKEFFRYLCIREGFMTSVYKDIYGKLTVGLGHLVQPADKLALGDVISPDRAVSLFKADIARLKINELKASAPHLNVAGQVGLASFAWTHGIGQFLNSVTHEMIKRKETTERQLLDWVAAHWDLRKPVNQERNEADLSLLFPKVVDGLTVHRSVSTSGEYVYLPLLNNSYTTLASGLAAGKLEGACRPSPVVVS